MFYRLVEFSGTIQLNLPTRQTKDVFRMAWGGILPCSRCKSSKIFAAPPPPHRNSLRRYGCRDVDRLTSTVWLKILNIRGAN